MPLEVHPYGERSLGPPLAERSIRRRDVRLIIDDAGLHEEVEGIRSFAPWQAVKSYARVNDVLLVELAADLWALIPAVAFLGEGAASEGDVIAVLNARGVHEREPDRARSFSPEHV